MCCGEPTSEKTKIMKENMISGILRIVKETSNVLLLVFWADLFKLNFLYSAHSSHSHTKATSSWIAKPAHGSFLAASVEKAENKLRFKKKKA
jgi:hypothetical protein